VEKADDIFTGGVLCMNLDLGMPSALLGNRTFLEVNYYAH
jgi:hypothetical protein